MKKSKLMIRMEDPPKAKRPKRRKEYDDAVAELKKSPGKFWLIAENAGMSVAQSLKNRGCEVVVRNCDKTTRRSDVYARWPEDAT